MGMLWLRAGLRRLIAVLLAGTNLTSLGVLIGMTVSIIAGGKSQKINVLEHYENCSVKKSHITYLGSF